MSVTMDPAGLSEPTKAPPLRWVAAFSLATAGMYAAWFGPLQILLARQAEAFSGDDGKKATLALVAAIGAAVSMLVSPLWGAVSDRTVSRFGRRIPWIVFGVVGAAAGLVALSQAESVLHMVLGWCLVQFALNATLAALTAAIPDQVPVTKRGVAGAYFGVASIAGVLVGSGLAVAGRTISMGYLLCAVFVVLGALPYALLRRDGVQTREQLPPWSLGEFLRGLWISPRVYPDFGWAWLTRFLMTLSNSILLLYLLYYLQDVVKVDDPETGVLVLSGVNALFLLATAVIAGIWSDRLGKRKVFVIGTGLLMSVAAFLLAVLPHWPVALLAAVVMGVGFGAYTSVDWALVTLVLPEAADRGKDLGLINVAATLPQVMAPIVAWPIVEWLGGYGSLYFAAGAVGLAGAVLVNKIRSVP
jgi:MFS family permease